LFEIVLTYLRYPDELLSSEQQNSRSIEQQNLPAAGDAAEVRDKRIKTARDFEGP
jgi:hypothetical protein